MRTYSHALLTWAATLGIKPQSPATATWASLGASIPDLPIVAGAAWLAARRRGLFFTEDLYKEACSRKVFRRPDAALHSVLPVAVALLLYKTSGMSKRYTGGLLLAFLLGWSGHVVADLLTHGEDSRPLLWPLSEWRFVSPVSYRERKRHARPFTTVEHAADLAAAAYTLTRRQT